MYATKSRSSFRFLLAGLLVALCVFTSVSEAAPTKALKTVARAGAPKKAMPFKAAARAATLASKGKAKAAAAKGGNKAAPPKAAKNEPKFCPIRRPNKKGAAPSGKQRLVRRAGVTHPPGDKPMIMFHGTKKEFATSVQKPDLTKTHTSGDLHHNKNGCVKGGMYFTDSVIAAAQYVCHRFGQPNPDTAYILKYQWTPPANVKIHTFPADSEPNDTQCSANDMVTSAMHNLPWDKDLSTDFWQYAIVNQDVMDKNLKYLETFVIPCANIYKGADLDSDSYIKGQGANPGFTAYVQGLVDGC